jgi:Ca-activated chloride channel family protein
MKRIVAFLAWLVLTGILLPIPQCRADGLIVIHESHWLPGPRPPHPLPPIWPPRPLPPPPRVYAPLEVVYHYVNVKIDGQIATTAVDQEFYNPNPQQLEGTYLFPVPRGAQIDKFTMDIGGKMVEAELLPAAKARQIYEDIVRKAKDPALLEYADRDVFKVRIFPIEPNGKKRVKLAYTQVLKAEGGLVNYTYPLNTEKFSAKPIKTVSIKVEIAGDRPLKSIYSPSHPVDIKRHGPSRATVGFETTDARPDTDFALYFAPEKDELGVNLVAHKVGDEDGYFLLLASPGMETKDKKVVPKDVAFVLDTSGSMAGKKLEQARKALLFCVENLNRDDRFEIVRFSTEVEPLFDKLVTATDANRDRANDFIKELKPIGGTAIDEALKKALALQTDRDDSRPFVVIFLTDGRPTIGTTDEEQIVAGVKRANEGRTRVFCFGIGTDVNTICSTGSPRTPAPSANTSCRRKISKSRFPLFSRRSKNPCWRIRRSSLRVMCGSPNFIPRPCQTFFAATNWFLSDATPVVELPLSFLRARSMASPASSPTKWISRARRTITNSFHGFGPPAASVI